MRFYQQQRQFFGICLCLFSLTIFTPLVKSQDQTIDYAAVLQSAVERACAVRGGAQLFWPSGGWNEPGPRFMPARSLVQTEAVPFLLTVLEQGPPGSDSEEIDKGRAYVARCYAALCLGRSGDTRAFTPLLQCVQQAPLAKDAETKSGSGDVDLSRCAALALGDLGDARAVAPLTTALQQHQWPECIYALARLEASQAAPTIIDVAAQRGYFCGEVHRALQGLLKTDFTVRPSPDGHRVKEFPELTPDLQVNVYQQLWQHWRKHGQTYAKQQFDRKYALLKKVRRENPLDHSRQQALQRSMMKGGIAAMPQLVSAIDQGDESLVPLVAQWAYSQQRQHRKNQEKQLRQDFRSQIENKKWWKDYRERQAKKPKQEHPTIERSSSQRGR